MNTLTHLIRPLLLALALSFAAGAPSIALGQETATSTTATVDLNHATAEELQTLPGIGPSKAAAIVAYRERRPFQRIEQIMRVRGIGRGTFRRIRDMLTVSPRR